MARGLLLRLINQIEWKLLFKGAAASILLFWVWVSGFSFFSFVVFFAGSAFLHFSESEDSALVRNSLLILSVSALIILRIVSGLVANALPELLIIISYGSLILLFLLLKRSYFRDQVFVYGIFNALTIFFFLLAVLSLRSAPAFIEQSAFWKIMSSVSTMVVLFLGVSVLVRDTFQFFGVSVGGKRIFLISGSLAFICAELVWITGFLPLGAINSAALIAVFLVLARDALFANFEGKLNTRFALREGTVFIAAVVLLFAASPWSI